jgi:alpha-ribazole phosphatase
MGILRFYWLRHAPPINPGNLCYGQADIAADISDDAAFTAQASRLPHDATWVSSPLIRTMETARKLAAFHANAHNITIADNRALIEQSFGDWEKLTRPEMHAHAAFPAYRADPGAVAPPNGESMDDLAARVIPAINDLIAAHPKGGNIVIVAHGGTIRSALHQATGLSMRDTLSLGVAPLSLSVIQYDPARIRHNQSPWSLESLNIKP